jgi:hypothetical protein
VTSFLRNASSVQPLFLLIEDLHWADRGTIDLLLHVARNLEGARLFLIGTYRDVEVDRAHPLSAALAELRRLGNFLRVPLRGLTVDEVQRMMSNIRGQDVSWARAEQIHRQTEGNPLFVQEVLRYLVEEGIVVRQGGRYAAANPDAYEASIPEGLRDVIGKRLSRVGSETNRLLSIAAVIGRDFNLATLRAVAGVEEEPLLAAIEEAVRIGVLEERSQPGRVLYRFAHAFFRQTLYEEMIAPRRLRLHQVVARALEEQYGSRRQEHAGELAEHFAQSTDPADLAKAVEYGELAAQRAMAVYAYAEAASHLERCLAVQEVLDPDDRAKKCALLLAFGEALIPAGEPLRAVDQVAEEAFSLAQALGASEKACRACDLATRGLYGYGGVWIYETQSFRLWAERYGAQARDGTADRVKADIDIANTLVADERWARGWLVLEGALNLARSLADRETILAVVARQTAPPYLSKHQPAKLHLAEEFFGQSRDGVSVQTLTRFLAGCCWVFSDWGLRTSAEQSIDELRSLAERTRNPVAFWLARLHQTSMDAIDGKLELAVAAAEALTEQAAEMGSPRLDRQNVAAFRPRLLLGRTEEALASMAAEDAVQVRQPPFKALALAHLGRHQESRQLIWQLLEADRQDDEDGFTLDYSSEVKLLEAAVICGDREAMGRLSDSLAGLAHLSIGRDACTCIARHLGASAAFLGKPDKARAYYDQALDACEAIRFRPEIALTHLQLAELLLEHYPDERAIAIGHLDFAIAEFRDMKMQPSLERALRHRELLKA